MQRACVHAGLWNILLSSLSPNKGISERDRQRERVKSRGMRRRSQDSPSPAEVSSHKL